MGAQVRVKPGVTDPDFADMPLGGWAGLVCEVDDQSHPPNYLIQWNQHTLDHMHPIHRKRCERDDLEVDSMWLGEEDIEANTGEPAVMEQPTNIQHNRLNTVDEDDRVRIALGLTADDPLPDVDSDTLQQYHRYLSAHLKFPFPGKYSEETGPFQDTTYSITVTGLVPAKDADEFEGLFCTFEDDGDEGEVPLGEVEVKKGNPNRQMVEDYSYWFWNYR